MKIKPFLIGALILLASCTPTKNSPTIRFPLDWLGIPGYGINIDQQHFVEPSGICFHPLRKTLFIVSDEGEIAEIKTDGTPVFNLKIPGDLEGIKLILNRGICTLLKKEMMSF